MPLTFTNQFSLSGVQPYYPGTGKRHHVALKPSTTYPQGTVLGEQTGTNEVQTLTITGTPTGGTFKLAYNGAVTTAIAYNAAAAAVQAALEALSTIGTGNVLGGGGALPGTPVTLTFQGSLANTNTAAVTVADNSLTGGTTPAAAIAETTRGRPPRGMFAAYASGNSDGSQTARAILEYACVTDANSNITFGGATGGGIWGETQLSAPAFFEGYFDCGDLVGLDATAVGHLGRLISGSVTNGVLGMP
jgi:hypothetical protein